MTDTPTISPLNPLAPLRLTSFSHGGGCGCKIAPGVLSEILKNSGGGLIPPELMVGIETADDAAVYRLNDKQALLSDPQTSGGLLVSCAADSADAVLQVFRSEGFAHAAVVGRMEQGPARLRVLP